MPTAVHPHPEAPHPRDAAGDSQPVDAAARRVAALLPGIGLSLAIAVVATILGRVEPIIGGPVFGVVLGMVAAAVLRPGTTLRPGIGFTGKHVLQASIVVLGTGLSLVEVVHTGVSSLPVMLGTLALAGGTTVVFGRLLHVDGNLRMLIGVGTGVCGASAIAAVTAVVGAIEVDVAYAISTIFAFNVAAVLLFPALGHLLGLSQHAFGLWAGTAINDTSSVVATAYTYGTAAGAYGVVIKLTRSLMIVPICLGLAARQLRRRRHGTGTSVATSMPWLKVFPWFIVYFLLAAAANTMGLVPHGWHSLLAALATFLITVALAGIGLSARFGTMRTMGVRPLLLGAALWATVAVGSLAIQGATGLLT